MSQDESDRRADGEASGTLPEEDRREPDTESEAPPPDLIKPPPELPSTKPIELPDLPEVEPIPEPVPVPLEEKLAALPMATVATFMRGPFADRWRIDEGLTGLSGSSRTYDRALRMVGAVQEHDELGTLRLIDRAGSVIEPD